MVGQSSKNLIKVFERLGYAVSKRKSGDHIAMRKDGSPRPVIFPDKKDIPSFIIINNLRTAGISREEYFKILDSL